MSSYVQIFIGPPDTPMEQIVTDVEAATGLSIRPATDPECLEGSDGERMVRMFVDGNIYEDESHLPSFEQHPVQLEFYTREKTIESERRFLDETFRGLRDTGRYSLFATLDLQTRIDPE